jgi:hypothetical protein
MEMKNTKRSAVIVGCARDCAIFLPAVLKNVSTIANLYSQAAFVFVENDSADDTPRILRQWLSKRACSFLICLNGLAAQTVERYFTSRQLNIPPPPTARTSGWAGKPRRRFVPRGYKAAHRVGQHLTVGPFGSGLCGARNPLARPHATISE